MNILLERERKRKGLSQARLAFLSGVDSTTISRIECGKIYAYPNWRRRLAKALDWPEELTDQLFETMGAEGGINNGKSDRME